MTDLAEARRVERAMDAAADNHDEPLEPDPHPDRTRTFSAMSLSRMRTRWQPDEEGIISAARAQAELELQDDFADVYRIMNRLYGLVREVMRHPDTGDPLLDSEGFAIWRRDEFGTPEEDWSRLTDRDKENFLHQITTRLLMWEQRAADLKGEALYAKAAWEERFAISFGETEGAGGRRPTEADRTQNAQRAAREQRYLAIYMTVRSNKAEALVRSMDRIAQRMKDTLR